MEVIFRFFQLWAQTNISCLKILVMTKLAYTFPKKKTSGKTLYILANGPSLNETLNNPQIKLGEQEVMCMNNFSTSSHFLSIRPKFYMLAAPDFFEDKVGEYYREYRHKILQTLADNTTWEMFMLLPAKAKKSSEWKNIVGVNKHIKIVYFNTTPLEGFSWFQNWSFKSGFGTPRLHNTLVACIHYGLMTGYKKMIFFGADHSWHEDIEVNEKNELIGKQNHFY